MSEKITFSGVPETMLQTVYARAKETKMRGAITDNKAVEPHRPVRLRFFDGRQGRGDAQRRHCAYHRAR